MFSLIQSSKNCFISRRYFSEWSKTYRPWVIEKKWQNTWKENNVAAKTDLGRSDNENFYALTMFPYPSGNLHMGHVRVYTISDCIARLKKMQGFNVFQPMGWDAFGLPAENAAIERGLMPSEWTYKNIKHMKNQLQKLGTDFNWDHELATCSPSYYKWTQDIFLRLYESGLAYQKQATVNWDPVDQTVLANEQVDDNGRSWRSGAVVERRSMTQWFFKITHYAESLLKELDNLDGWPDMVKSLQRNWIGKSTGSQLDFSISESLPNLTHKSIRVFTTRIDTIFGVTFIALAPDHPLVKQHLGNDSRVEDIIKQAKEKSASFMDNTKSKEGFAIGLHAINPFNGDKIPIYVTDYVLSEYGSGAVMGVPAHDQRDYEFAVSKKLPIVKVISSNEKDSSSSIYSGKGTLINSGPFSGMTSEEAARKMNEQAKKKSFGEEHTQYRLRDWLISRQRYWGAPIPLIHCKSCGVVPVPRDQLPVELPENVKFTGKGTVLAQAEDWVNCSCPKCKGAAKRETDTMDTFVDSSWYYLRFLDSQNSEKIFNPEIAEKWMPVDVYVGGIEHAILHLLYARFINKVLFDQKMVPSSEPFKNLINQGMVHGRTMKHPNTGRFLKPDEVDDPAAETPIEKETNQRVQICFEKMSKSKYNGVDPEPIIEQFGADTTRLFMLFKAPPEAVLDWDMRGVQGQHRWINRLWTLIGSFVNNYSKILKESSSNSSQLGEEDKTILRAVHSAIKGVTQATSLETHTFNVGIAELMKLSNTLDDVPESSKSSTSYYLALRSLVVMLAPMAPHISSEFWEALIASGPNIKSEWAGDSAEKNVLKQQWPTYDPNLIVSSTRKLGITISGKRKSEIEVPADLKDPIELEKIAREGAGNWIRNKKVLRVIVTENVINFVVEK